MAKLNGQIHDIVITDMAFGGDGVGRINGQVVFIPFVITGETVKIKIISEKKGILRGNLLEVLIPSPHRITPKCKVFGSCGGCQYQHIDYPEQIALKTKQVTDCLERIGKIPAPPVKKMILSPLVYHYRNKITVHTRGGLTGFLDTSGSKIVTIQDCPLADEGVNTKLSAFLLKNDPPEGDHAFRNLPGEAHTLAPQAFYQTNTQILPGLLSLVGNLLPGTGDTLIDTYCGAGFFTFEFSPRFLKVVGIELEPRAISAALARKNQESTKNIEFIAGAVESVLHDVLAPHQKNNVTLILDPPRTGCEPRVIEILQILPPQEIIYVSCNPSTLARDIQRLHPKFELLSITPIDMFPQTSHIECVAHLVRTS
ncbi:MAG: class I SAM-dependent RNA methyltransferase [Verrucomicrobiota bacterium]|nr:class I SAM-dependent RNA methyltransferase [Verrucomicrobiota bacterium]